MKQLPQSENPEVVNLMSPSNTQWWHSPHTVSQHSQVDIRIQSCPTTHGTGRRSGRGCWHTCSSGSHSGCLWSLEDTDSDNLLELLPARDYHHSSQIANDRNINTYINTLQPNGWEICLKLEQGCPALVLEGHSSAQSGILCTSGLHPEAMSLPQTYQLNTQQLTAECYLSKEMPNCAGLRPSSSRHGTTTTTGETLPCSLLHSGTVHGSHSYLSKREGAG